MPGRAGRAAIAKFQDYVREAGRDPAEVGLDGRVGLVDGVDEAVRLTETWQDMGATHVDLNTMNVGLESVDDHIASITRFKEALDSVAAG